MTTDEPATTIATFREYMTGERDGHVSIGRINRMEDVLLAVIERQAELMQRLETLENRDAFANEACRQVLSGEATPDDILDRIRK